MYVVAIRGYKYLWQAKVVPIAGAFTECDFMLAAEYYTQHCKRPAFGPIYFHQWHEISKAFDASNHHGQRVGALHGLSVLFGRNDDRPARQINNICMFRAGAVGVGCADQIKCLVGAVMRYGV